MSSDQNISDHLVHELMYENDELDRTVIYDSQNVDAPMDLGQTATTPKTAKRRVDELGDTNDEDAPINKISRTGHDRQWNFNGKPMHVYIKGIGFNLATEGKKRLGNLQAEVNDHFRQANKIEYRHWRIQGDYIRITCQNEQQVETLMSIKQLFMKPVDISLAWSVTRNTVPKPYKKQFMVFGIPADIPFDTVIADNNCTGRRLPDKNGVYSAIITPNNENVEFIVVGGMLRRKMVTYYPRPMQCSNCWAYGHSRHNCGNRPTCEFCGIRGHAITECHGVPAGKQPKCVNCHGSHKATDKTCPTLTDNKTIKKISIDENLSYKDARVKWLNNNQHNNQPVNNTVHTESTDTRYRDMATRKPTLLAKDDVTISKNILCSILENIQVLNLVVQNLFAAQIPYAEDMIPIYAALSQHLERNTSILFDNSITTSEDFQTLSARMRAKCQNMTDAVDAYLDGAVDIETVRQNAWQDDTSAAGISDRSATSIKTSETEKGPKKSTNKIKTSTPPPTLNNSTQQQQRNVNMQQTSITNRQQHTTNAETHLANTQAADMSEPIHPPTGTITTTAAQPTNVGTTLSENNRHNSYNTMASSSNLNANAIPFNDQTLEQTQMMGNYPLCFMIPPNNNFSMVPMPLYPQIPNPTNIPNQQWHQNLQPTYPVMGYFPAPGGSYHTQNAK